MLTEWQIQCLVIRRFANNGAVYPTSACRIDQCSAELPRIYGGVGLIKFSKVLMPGGCGPIALTMLRLRLA